MTPLSVINIRSVKEAVKLKGERLQKVMEVKTVVGRVLESHTEGQSAFKVVLADCQMTQSGGKDGVYRQGITGDGRNSPLWEGSGKALSISLPEVTRVKKLQ